MQKKQLPPPPPFNPYMFPFPFSYPPPPYLNPMMNLPPKPNAAHGQDQHYPPIAPPMPPFGYPPFPMMYPPPPEAFFRFHEQRNAQKQPYDLNPQQQNKSKGEIREEGKKKAPPPIRHEQKKNNEIIVLSDDEMPVCEVKPFPIMKKKYLENKINISVEPNQEIKPRRTERKVISALKPETYLKKTRIIEKKKQSKINKQKQQNQNYDAKQVKFTMPTSTETGQDYISRHTRVKYLTIKEGKGKIMIGDQYQTAIPPFISKDQNYTIWLADVKKNLFARFHKDGV